MNKIDSMDFLKDNNPKILNYVKKIIENVPDYVKSASTDEKRTAWADPDNEEFPMDTASDVWQSYAYIKNAKEKPANYDSIVRSLKLAAVVFDIEKDLELIDAALANSVKSASKPQVKYAYLMKMEDGKIYGFYPISNKEDIIKSAVRLGNEKDRMTLDIFRDISKTIVKEANALGIDLSIIPDSVLKYGEDRLPDVSIFKKIAEQRIRDLPGKETGIYSEIVSVVEADPYNKELAEEMAKTFYEVDQIMGVKYANKVNGTVDPFLGLFCGMKESTVDKLATEVVLYEDIVIPVEEFKKASSDKIQNYFSKKNFELLDELISNSDGIEMSIKLASMDKKVVNKFLELLADGKLT